MIYKKPKLPGSVRLNERGHTHHLMFFLLVIGFIAVVGVRVYNSDSYQNIALLNHPNNSGVLGAAVIERSGEPATSGGTTGTAVPKLPTSSKYRPSELYDKPVEVGGVGLTAQDVKFLENVGIDSTSWSTPAAPKGVMKNVSESNGKKIYNPPGIQSVDKEADIGVGGVTYPASGYGSRGLSGGKIAKKATITAFGSVAILNILKDGKQQQTSKYYEFGQRRIVVNVYQAGTTKLVNVGVAIRMHAMPTISNGCNVAGSAGSARPVIYIRQSGGRAIFQNCPNTQFDVYLTDIPANLRGGLVKLAGGGFAAVSAQPGRHNVMKIDIQLKPTDDVDVRIKPKNKTQTQPSAVPGAAGADECVKTEGADNLEGVQGSASRTVGGLISYSQHGIHSDNHTLVLEKILNKGALRTKDSADDLCNRLIHSRSYYITINGSSFADSNAKPVQGVTVRLVFRGQGKCLGKGPGETETMPTSKTNIEGKVTFYNCTKNNINMTLTGVGEYVMLRPLEQHGKNRYGVRVESSPGRRLISPVVLKSEMVRAYPPNWRIKFNEAAVHYWSSRHADGIPTDDRRAFKGNLARFPGTATCRPGDVKVVASDLRPGVYANAGYGADTTGAKLKAHSNPGSSNCVIQFNSDPGVRKVLSNYTYACIIYVHEYGHFLGYPDFSHKDLRSGIKVSDVMFNHLLNTVAVASSTGHRTNEFQELVNNTGCEAIFQGRAFPTYHSVALLAGAGAGAKILNKNGSGGKKQDSPKFKFNRYSPKTKDHFAVAAREYWKNHQTPGPNYPGMGNPVKLGSADVECTPGEVKFNYSKRMPAINPNASLGTQYEYIMDARPGGAYVKHKREWKNKGYCEVKVNKSETARMYTQDNPAFTCALFIHAYGRLLGYGNTNQYPSYTMYYLVNRQSAAAIARDTKCASFFPVGGTGL